MADERDESHPAENSRSFGRDSSGLRDARNTSQSDGEKKPVVRSGAARNPFVVAGNALFIVFVLVALAGYFSIQRFNAPGPLGEDKIVYIPPGSGTNAIAETLERQGVIEGESAFTTGLWLHGHSSDLKKGEYLFKARMSMRDVMNVLVAGKAIQHAITIPEGLTSAAIIARLEQDDILSGETGPVPPEGSLLPETYHYVRGMTRKELVDRMQKAMKVEVDRVWRSRGQNLPLRSSAELVILASIVEKETGQADERPHVASVFINRLNKNMRLQSDPTVIYGIVGGKGKLDRALLSADLAQPTPFNTYTNFGLPPSPIANPGKAALEAVASPLPGKDLYFVADGTGGHAFAETLDQHNRNVARWRQRQQQPNTAPAPAENNASPSPTGSVADEPGTSGNQPLDGAASGNKPPASVTGRKGGFDDPVANTSKDPLLNKTYDLNSPQAVQ